mmetsp:Transcript_702/g.1212  ORF Transcript_702/g.1212 Transcript_702/m.1212 type:complete len:550 (+) Transcript_702:112-1761(+)
MKTQRRTITSKPSPLSPVLKLAEQIELKNAHMKSPEKLKNHTQKTALQLYKNEEKRAVRSRLECLLVQQLTKKYGAKNPNSVVNMEIKRIVIDFVTGFDDVRKAEASIGALEAQVKQEIGQMKEKIRRETSAKQKARAASANMPTIDTGAAASAAQAASQNTSGRGGIDIDEKQWPVINAIMAAAAEEKQEREAAAVRAKRLKYQQELGDQIERNKRNKDVSKVEKEQALHLIQADLSAYEQQIANENARKEDMRRRETAMRQSQIEERKSIKERERQQRIAEEQGIMQRARRIAREEEEERMVERERQKLAQEALKKENEFNKEIKMEAIRKNQAYEMKLNADYEAKLEREEQARQSAFQKRVDELAKFSNGYEQRVGERLQAQKEADEKLVMQNILEAERKRAERDKIDEDRRRSVAKRNQQWNIDMMERKQRQQQEQKIDNLNRRAQMEADLQEAKRKERELAERKRLQMIELKNNLDNQVTQRETGVRNYGHLSDIEEKMNKSILKKLAEDPALMNRVATKVQPLIASSRSGGGAPSARQKNILY